jgi:hypothetical protein
MAEDPSNLPARQVPLDRVTIERVLARAAELQASSGSSDDGIQNLSEAQLIEIGNEVGISSTTLTQALAEERSRIAVPEDHGLVASITGPAVATASRPVRGTPSDILASLDNWMQSDECLQVQRRFPDRITWEPKVGWLGVLQRGFNVSGRGYHLCRATQVAATVVPIEGGRVLVRLDADLSESRNSRLKVGGSLITGGVLTAGGLSGAAILMTIPFVIVGGIAAVPLLIGAAAAYGVAKRHRELVMRVQLALEQTLDRLEYGSTRRLR